MKIFRFLCLHKMVKVIRYHPDIVPYAWVGRELYTDKHKVVNFVQCCGCGKVFETKQTEHLWGMKKD